MLEDAVIIREMQLELKCSNVGLVTPIELKEIENIIELDNYDELLEEMINKRLQIQEQVKIQMQQQEEQKQELLKQEELRKQKEFEEKAKKEKEQVIKQQQETGKKVVALLATFEVEVNANIEDNKVWSKYVVELQKQFKTFVNLEIKNQ